MVGNGRGKAGEQSQRRRSSLGGVVRAQSETITVFVILGVALLLGAAMGTGIIGDIGANEDQELTTLDTDVTVEGEFLAAGMDGDGVTDRDSEDERSAERGGPVDSDDELLPELTVSIEEVEGEVGETVGVDLNVTSFSEGSGDEFGSYSFVLSYDEEVLAFEGLETGVWDEPAGLNASSGVVAFADFDAAGETPAEPVLTLEFEVVDEGTSAIVFDDDVPGIPAINTINNEFARPYAIQFEAGSAGTDEQSFGVTPLSFQRGPGANFFSPTTVKPGPGSESVSTAGVTHGQSGHAASTTSEVPERPVGDATKEGVVTIADAQAIADFVVGDPPEEFDEFLANVSRQDEGVQIADAQLISDFVVGSVTPPNTTITGFDPAETITAGDAIAGSPTVTNVGELGTIQSVDYRIAEDEAFDDVVFEETIAIADLTPTMVAGNQTVLDLDVTPDIAAGEYTQGLFSEGVPPTGEEEINGSVTAPLVIEPAEPDEVAVDVEPEETTAGAAIEGHPAAIVTDEFGNTIEGVEMTVEVAGEETLDAGETTVETDEEGIATFEDLVIEAAGTYTLTFEVEEVDTAETDEFEVVPADEESVSVEVQPEETVAGETIEGPPAANVTDEFGNAVEDVSVTVAVAGEGELDAGTTTVATNESGIATFEDLVVETAGTYTLTFDADGVAENATTDEFDIVSASPDSVTVEVEPEETVAGETIEGLPAGNVTDEFGNAVEGVSVTVAVAGEGELDAGTTTVATNESGIATFDDLVIEAAGTYTLSFDAVGVGENATTEAFDIVPATVDSVELDPEADQPITAGDEIAFSAVAYDAFDNVIEDDDAAFTWDAEGGSISGDGLFDESDAAEAGTTYNVTAVLDAVTSAPTPVTVEPADVETVELDPEADQTITAGEEIAFSAVAYDEFDNVVESSDSAFTWDAEGGSISEDGLFDETDAAEDETTYNVTAELDDVTSAGTAVTVEPADVETVELDPEADQTITAGEEIAFSAVAYDAFDNVVESSDSAFTWDAEGGSISDDGLFDETDAAEAGTTYDVTAALDAVTSAPTAVTVEPADVETVELDPEADQPITAGEEIAFSAVAYDAFDNVVESSDSAFTWDAEGGSISDDGLFDETDVGEYNVTAELDTVTSAATTVTVDEAAVDTIELAPEDDQTITAGEEVAFSAVAYDAFDNVVEDDDTAFAWDAEDGSIGGDGVFDETDAAEAGTTYDVTAELDDVTSAPTPVTVEPADVETVELDPETDQPITAGEEIAFSAVAYDAFNNVVESSDSAFTWDGSGGSIAGDGLFDETTAGEYDVTAELDAVTSAATTVTVDEAAVDSVELDPETDQPITAGEEIAFSAVAYDAFDNVVEDDDTAFSWDGSGGSIGGDGLFDETDVGEYDVTAALDGVTSAATTVTVDEAAVDTIELDPEDDQDIVSGETVAFSAVAYDAFGNAVEDDDTAFSWDGSGGSIGGDGLFDETTAGEYDVTAELDGVTSAATTVTVLSPAEFEVTITNADDVVAGETLAVDAFIENVGDVEATQTVTMDAAELGDDSASVTLGGGESTVETFTAETSVGEAGDYTVTVSSENDTDTASVTVLSPAEFEVTITSADDVIEGETLEVEAYIENVGDVEGTQTVTLDAGDLGTDSASITLAGDDATFETFTVETSVGDAGDYTVMVSSEDDTDSASVTLLESVFFDVTLTGTNAPVAEGETLSVDAFIENTGEAEDTQTVTMDGAELGDDSASVTLGGGESTVETFTVETSVGDADDYTVTVSSEDDTDSTTVTVQELAVSVAAPADVTEASPGTYTYTFDVSNTGGADDTYDLTVSETEGWSVSIDGSTTRSVDAGDTEQVAVDVTIPDGAGGVTSTVQLEATSQSNTNVSDSDSMEVTLQQALGVNVDAGIPEIEGGQFQLSGTGTQTVDVGFEPDVIKFELTSTNSNFDTESREFREEWGWGHGFAHIDEDGSIEEVAMTVGSGSDSTNGMAAATTDAYSISQVLTPSDGNGITGWIEASVTDTDDSGFTLQVDSADQSQYVTYTAYQFEDDADVDVGYFDTPTSTGADSVSTGFEPNFLQTVIQPHGGISGMNDQVQDSDGDNGWGHGVAVERDGTIDQLSLAVSMHSENIDYHSWGSSDTDVLYTLRMKPKYSGITGRIKAGLQSFDTDGFTLDYSHVEDGQPALYLAVDTDAEPDVGHFETPTSTGTQTVNTDAKLDTVSLVASNTIAQINDEQYVSGEHHGWMFGSATPADQRAMGFSSHSQSVNGHAFGSSATDGFHLMYSDRDGYIQGRDKASITSISGNSFDLEWSDIATTSDGDVNYDSVTAGYHGFSTDQTETSPDTYTYDFTVANTGNGPDTYDLSVDDTNGWSVSVPDTVSIDYGQTETVGVDVTIPSGAEGETSDVTLTASTDDGTVTDSDSLSVTLLEPATFDVSIDSTNSPVTEGETLSVDASITNTGDIEDTQTVTLSSDLGSDSQSLTLDNAESTTVTLTTDTSTGDAGTYTVTVSSDDDSDSETVEVEQPAPEFEFSNTALTNLDGSDDYEYNVLADHTMEFSFTIENTGTADGTANMELWFDITSASSPAATLDVAVDAGETVSDSITYTPDENGGAGYAIPYDYWIDLGESGDQVAVSDQQVLVGEPDIAIDSVSGPGQINHNDDLVISYTLENTGDVDHDVDTVELLLDGSVGPTDSSVTVPAGGTYSDDLTYTDADDDYSAGDTIDWDVRLSDSGLPWDDNQQGGTTTIDSTALEAPFRTESDFNALGDTFEDNGGDTEYQVDTSTSSVEGASGYLSTLGTGGNGDGTVSWTEDLTSIDSLTFEYQANSMSSSWGIGQVLVDGNVEWEASSQSSWTQESIDLTGYSGDVEIGFRMDARGTGWGSREMWFDDVQLEGGFGMPIETETEFDTLGDTFVDSGGDVEYQVDTSESSVDGASGYFSTLGTGGYGYGEVSWTEDVSNQDTILFDFKASSLSSWWAEAQVLIDGNVEWSSTNNPSSWSEQSVDISGYSGEVDIAFRLDADGTNFGSREYWFDNVRFAGMLNMPIETESEFDTLGDTFDDVGGDVEYQVDTSESSVEGASGYFSTLGTNGNGHGDVSFTEDVSGENTLTFDYKANSMSSSWATAQVLIDGNVEWEAGSYNPDSWEEVSVDISDYSGQVEVAFRLDARGTCCSWREFWFDNVQLSGFMPVETEGQFDTLADSFVDSGGDVEYQVDTSESSVAGASGYFSTLGTGGNGYGEVYWTEDVTGEGTITFDFKASTLSSWWAEAKVLIDGNVEWSSANNPDSWEEQSVDVSGYSGEVDIAFRLDAQGTGLDYREFWFDNVQFN